METQQKLSLIFPPIADIKNMAKELRGQRAVEMIEGLIAARDPDRLYPILTCRYHDFYAGRAGSGQQLLAGEWSPEIIVALFDDTGSLRKVEYRTLESTSGVEEQLCKWYGYTSGLVRVKRFCISAGPIQATFPQQWSDVGEPRFTIAPFPFDWEECYGNPADFPIDDPDYVEMVRGWIERGNFALCWGNELHLDDAGQVVGS